MVKNLSGGEMFTPMTDTPEELMQKKLGVCAPAMIVSPLFTQLILVKMDQVDPLGWWWLVPFSVGAF